ncbi:unnamed protein product [Paramecium octaurelia]|uniref:Major facilitator superfamily (MFS) profile domain-containing protein n=1 Tax=Paramecium octaurelia TaxID=43137 RepID=A0A8S1T141_PAROT|nr:unnamed protein product [Paramecium octaurelia]
MLRSSSFLGGYSRSLSKNKLRPRVLSYRHTKLRYLALFFACMIMIGDAYCFDNPMALQSEIKDKYGVDQFKFNLLYTVYSLPNIILPFFGGVLIDKIGARTAILLFSSIIMIGQLVCVWGASNLSYWTLITGRVIFGMGSESLNVSQNSIMAIWFKDQEMSLAIGLCISIPKIGNALNSLLSPQIYSKYQSLAAPMIVGVGTLIFSFICGIALIYMDYKSEQREKQNQMLLNKNDENHRSQSELSASVKQSIKDDDCDSPDLGRSPEIFATPQRQEEPEEHEVKEEINFKDIAKLSGTFWILIIICMLTEALFVPFLDNGNELLQERFGMTAEQAGLFLIIPYLVASGSTPFIGNMADKFGRRSLLIIVTSFIFLITHILFIFRMCTSACFLITLPLTILGLCFGFYASVVIPSVPFVVKSNLVGTAFGLTGVFQNTALALFPMITGMIFNQFKYDEHGEENEERGYVYQSFFFIGMSVLLVIIAILLMFVDKNGERKLSQKGRGIPKKNKVDYVSVHEVTDIPADKKISINYETDHRI